MSGQKAFAAAVREAVKNGEPSRGANLAGMEADFDYFLSTLPQIEERSVTTKRTGQPEVLLEVRCRLAGSASLAEAGDAVVRVWTEQLRYDFREAHHLDVAEHEGRFTFCTQMSADGLYVTGAVIISPCE